MRFTIYQLVDPRDHQPRYVGYTENLERRYQDYLNGLPHSKALRRWLAELKALGLQPLMIPLEVVEETLQEVLQRERYWIKTFIDSGITLLNAYEHTTRQARKQKTILLEPARARWLEIQAATERREQSEIVADALALYERLYVEKKTS